MDVAQALLSDVRDIGAVIQQDRIVVLADQQLVGRDRRNLDDAAILNRLDANGPQLRRGLLAKLRIGLLRALFRLYLALTLRFILAVVFLFRDQLGFRVR